MKRAFWFCVLAGLCLSSSFAQQSSTASAAKAAVPTLVNFSGTLTDLNGKPLTGTVGVTFYLYKDEQGGSPLWLETQNVQPDRSGHYSVMLGSTHSTGLPSDIFVAGEARWLSVQPQGQKEFARVMLLSVPYALKAGDAQTIAGLPPSAFVLAAPSPIAPASPSSNTSSPNPPPPASAVTTSGGVVNALPLWTTGTNIQSSSVTQSGSGATAKIGIDTTTPTNTLDVKGTAIVRGAFTLPATGVATATHRQELATGKLHRLHLQQFQPFADGADFPLAGGIRPQQHLNSRRHAQPPLRPRFRHPRGNRTPHRSQRHHRLRHGPDLPRHRVGEERWSDCPCFGFHSYWFACNHERHVASGMEFSSY